MSPACRQDAPRSRRTEEVREVRLGGVDLPPKPASDERPVALEHLGGQDGRVPGIPPQLEDPAANRGVGDPGTSGADRDGCRLVGEAPRRAVRLDHPQPSVLQELEQAHGARRRGSRLSRPARLLVGEGAEIGGVDARPRRGLQHGTEGLPWHVHAIERDGRAGKDRRCRDRVRDGARHGEMHDRGERQAPARGSVRRRIGRRADVELQRRRRESAMGHVAVCWNGGKEGTRGDRHEEADPTGAGADSVHAFVSLPRPLGSALFIPLSRQSCPQSGRRNEKGGAADAAPPDPYLVPSGENVA